MTSMLPLAEAQCKAVRSNWKKKTGYQINLQQPVIFFFISFYLETQALQFSNNILMLFIKYILA